MTERGGRIKPAEINARFVAYRDALGLPRELSPHSLRHSYVTHLTEDGADRRFIQEQVGHRCDTSTAIYTHVSGDFMNTALRKAIGPALDAPGGNGRGVLMARKLDYRWHLRQVMAGRGMFATTDLIEPLAAARDPAVLQPGLPAGRRTAGAAEPEDPDGAAGHPGLLDGRADRTGRRASRSRREDRPTAAGRLRPGSASCGPRREPAITRAGVTEPPGSSDRQR